MVSEGGNRTVIRIGTGYDVHRLVKGRELVIGGVKIDYHLGLEGHSDADVLTHALIDALLGAAGLGDLGCHFPAGDDSYRNISSLKLLEEVKVMLDARRWKLVNADLVLIAEAPTFSPFAGQICEKLAAVLEVPISCFNVKATTTEGLGFCGRGEGIAAQAVVLIEKVALPGPGGHEAG